MPHLPASPALSRFTVLDLTRVRAGPTCVRQLADWGANVIKVEMPDQRPDGHGLGGPRAGSDFQNLHRNKRSLTLNLKAAKGGNPAAPGRARRRGGREFPPRGQGPAQHRLRRPQGGQSAHRARQHLRLRPGRAVCQAAGLRSDRARHGRPDVGDRLAGPGPSGSASRSPTCAPVCSRPRAFWSRCWSARLGRGPVDPDLAVAGAGIHAGFSGDALVGRP